MSGAKLEEFSLRGIYRLDHFWPVAGATCDLCLRFNQTPGVPATCRQVEYGGDVPASWGRPALLVDGAGKPLATTVEETAIRNPVKRERCLCKRHQIVCTQEALERRIIVIQYDKPGYTSVNEVPPEWRKFYRQAAERQAAQRQKIVEAN